jgi:hypothetical protein
VNLLEVQELRDSRVHEDVMTPAYATETKPEGLSERASLGEPEVVRGRQRLLKELSRVHVLEETLARPALGRMARRVTPAS